MNWRTWQPGCWTLFGVALIAVLTVTLVYTVRAVA